MGRDRDKVLRKRSKEAKALEKKQYRQRIVPNKKKRKLLDELERQSDGFGDLSGLGEESDI